MKRTDSQETPPTPLYDEDMSQPLGTLPKNEIMPAKGGNALEATPTKRK
jgi:hypothetical protein